MDVRLSDGSGIEATRDIRAQRPKTQVLMLTSFADDEALFASIMAGAAGYVLKQIKGDELVRAIRAVGAGQSLLDPAVTKGVLDRLRKGKHLLKDEKLARLSPQEERILGLVADGLTNGQIGQELGLAEKTVKNYVSSILAKLEVARRAEAAAYLARHTTIPGTWGSMFVRYYMELPLPARQVEHAMLDAPAEWLSTVAGEAQRRGDHLLTEVGVGPLGAQARSAGRHPGRPAGPLPLDDVAAPDLGAGRAGRRAPPPRRQHRARLAWARIGPSWPSAPATGHPWEPSGGRSTGCCSTGSPRPPSRTSSTGSARRSPIHAKADGEQLVAG